MRAIVTTIILMSLCACSYLTSGPTYTLYREGHFDQSLRVHWATFNANQSGSYNQENCEMAADLLNRNLRELNNGIQVLSFWCEEGGPTNISG